MIARIVKLVNYYFLLSLCFYIFTNSINLILFNYIRKAILGSFISTFSPSALPPRAASPGGRAYLFFLRSDKDMV